MSAINRLQAKHYQAIIVVAGALSLLTIASIASRRENPESGSNSQTLSGSEQGSQADGNLFSLPQASPDFVGAWYGVLAAVRREPRELGWDTHAFGVGFHLENQRVVMKLALWAGAEAKIIRLTAASVDSKHVRVDNDITTRDTRGVPMWIRERRDIVSLTNDTLECTETVNYFRDPNFITSVGIVQYRGPLKRASESQMKAHEREMSQKGMTKQAETETSVPER